MNIVNLKVFRGQKPGRTQVVYTPYTSAECMHNCMHILNCRRLQRTFMKLSVNFNLHVYTPLMLSVHW